MATVPATPDEPKTEPTANTVDRGDALDLGVPMLPGDPNEPVGPEDALGAGPTRGDYRNRIGDGFYEPHTSELVTDAKPGEPTVRVVAQRQNAEEIGDVAGVKGGVDTVTDAKP